MTKNPILNALAAVVYIAAVVSVIYLFAMFDKPDVPIFIIPMAMISLFTLSAAVMGYLFLGQPVQLYLDGDKSHAVRLFLQTVGVFAAITVLILLVALLSSALS